MLDCAAGMLGARLATGTARASRSAKSTVRRLTPTVRAPHRLLSRPALPYGRKRKPDLRHHAGMGDRYRTADGWAVEVVELSATPDRNDGERLKVTYCGFFARPHGRRAGDVVPAVRP
jgi:hypothetical protein